MMKYKGDLIIAAQKGELDVIAHQANCFCTMNSGIARQIRLAFPEAYEADRATTTGDRDKLGTISCGFHYGLNSVLTIFNLYGQYNYGKKGLYTDYKALLSSFLAMEERLKKLYPEEIRDRIKIGFPKIGAGLGGGDWNIISGYISQVFKDWNVVVYEL